MIPRDVTVYVATAPVDMRLSFDRLAGIVRDQLGAEPREPVLVVFHNRRRTHVKLLWHDGRGTCVLYKRLDRGTYRIPLAIPPQATRVQVSRRELRLLFEGIDHAKLASARRRIGNSRR
jgi:transposase